MLMYMMSSHASSVSIIQIVMSAIGMWPKCSGSFSAKSTMPMTAKMKLTIMIMSMTYPTLPNASMSDSVTERRVGTELSMRIRGAATG